jgi:hypothetical protein
MNDLTDAKVLKGDRILFKTSKVFQHLYVLQLRTPLRPQFRIGSLIFTIARRIANGSVIKFQRMLNLLKLQKYEILS